MVTHRLDRAAVQRLLTSPRGGVSRDRWCPDAVRLLFRHSDNQLEFRYMPCKVKACPACGPYLRAKYAAQWAHAMAGEVIYRFETDDAELAKLRRRRNMRGHKHAHVPLPGNRRAIYTTAPIGEALLEVRGALNSDFTDMPSDARRWFLSDGWRQAVKSLEVGQAAEREPWECLGQALLL